MAGYFLPSELAAHVGALREARAAEAAQKAAEAQVLLLDESE